MAQLQRNHGFPTLGDDVGSFAYGKLYKTNFIRCWRAFIIQEHA